MSNEKLDNNIIEITTPFLDRNNDYTQIYVKSNGNNKLILSDYGYMINELEMLGIDINSPKRKEIIETIINRFGVKLVDGTLSIEATVQDYPRAKHSLLQAMLAIDDLFYLSRPNIISIFSDEVESFFNENEIYYIPNISFVGMAGYTHNYDFALQKSKHNPERLVKAVNSLTKSMTESILFAWHDTKAVRKNNSVLYAIINDKNKIPDKSINALENYGVLPIPWSKRDEYLGKLA